MRRQVTIFIVFSYLLLINGAKAALLENTFIPQEIRTEKLLPDTIKPKKDSVVTSIDTVAADEGKDIESEITYEADDSLRMEPENKKIYLFGNAKVHYEDFDLKAAYIEIDNKNNLVTAMGVADSSGKLNGNPEFKEGQSEMTCEKIVYNIKTKKGKITGILTKQSDMFIHGEAVKKDSNNVMYIKNMKCIPCEFDDAKIYFRASKAKVIPNDKIITGPLFVEVMNIPTPLGAPFGYFPNVKNKSKTGILMPYYGSSQAQGYFLKNLGFFMPTGDKVQFILYGDIYSNGSFALRPTTTYKVNYKYSGGFTISFSQFNLGIPEDRTPLKTPEGVPINDPNRFTRQQDFRINWNHSQDRKNDPTISFNATINAGSAGFNKVNNQTPGVYLNNTLTSNIMFSKSFKNSTLTLNARHNQNTSSRDLQIDAPGLMFAVTRFFPFKNAAHTTQNWLDKLYMDYTFQVQGSIKEKDFNLFKPKTLDSLQYGMVHKMPIGTNISLFKYFTLNPQVNLMGYTYFQTVEKNWNPVTNDYYTYIRRMPSFAGDANIQTNLTTKVYGDYVFKSKFIPQIRHQVIPTLGFVYHPELMGQNVTFYNPRTRTELYEYGNTDAYGNGVYYSRFERGIFGGPAGVESGNITFNVNNTFDAKVRQRTDTGNTYKKVTLLQMLSIGGSYDVAAKKNNFSVVNLSGRTSLIKNIIGVMSTATFDPYSLDSLHNRSNK
ncbi:MAG TPA: putative LPS assembly protein LptD, partial [Bacteroidia bacterium]|nr:putative LPS assembly protein LptD [Bacteroidia bacterium]